MKEHSLGKQSHSERRRDKRKAVTGSLVLSRSSAPGFQMDQKKRFYLAMALYVVLALLVWFTMDDSSVPVAGGQVSLRTLTFALLGFFAARTVLHWNAERIRAEKESQLGAGNSKGVGETRSERRNSASKA